MLLTTSVDKFNFVFTDFVVSFVENYRYEEGEGDSVVCLEGVGQIAHPATASVSSAIGTATGESWQSRNFLYLLIILNVAVI